MIQNTGEIIRVINDKFGMKFCDSSKYHMSIGEYLHLEYNAEMSLCMLSWNFMCTGLPIWYINYISDEAMKKYAIPNSAKINYIMFIEPENKKEITFKRLFEFDKQPQFIDYYLETMVDVYDEIMGEKSK